MTLNLIGLGLGDEKDISVRGLEIVKRADFVYLENYTSILSVDRKRLEEFYGRSIKIADRDLVEKRAEEMLVLPAKREEVVLLVVGDPFGATTHTDLVLRAHKEGVKVNVVHNASIINAVGVVGLELYKYGKSTSIPFWSKGFEPETPYNIIKENKDHGSHTLCLLDIKVAEPSREDMLKGIERGKRAPRFMTIKEVLQILLTIEKKRKENVLSESTLVVGVARLGQKDQQIVATTVKELMMIEFNKPLHTLIIPGELQVIEEEALAMWKP